jgi:hypothetical protein
MDETFAFIAPVMPRRAVHPMAIRAAVASTVFVAAIGALGVFVIEHEQAADARRDALVASVAQAEAAQVREAATQASLPAGLEASVDGAAAEAAEEALGYARAVLEADGSLAAAGPAELATVGSARLFVDGPSTAPSVVSVAATDSSWAAAVAGSDGCVWVALSADGGVLRDVGEGCTGAAALAVLVPGS